MGMCDCGWAGNKFIPALDWATTKIVAEDIDMLMGEYIVDADDAPMYNLLEDILARLTYHEVHAGRN